MGATLHEYLLNIGDADFIQKVIGRCTAIFLVMEYSEAWSEWEIIRKLSLKILFEGDK